ncbi:sporulation protein YunB [Hazenella sp. IB182357]|uniref:Sporulation protein YunB n=1 Tax=Polycladospora coralii TaxID=2771432 RepID=A0A926N9B4_9BACL|nr:sporulation protein YunB [Polycladospora coralii]MBD1370850.1 sporulation protein YunB [Polycladospora coralii]MBS7529789.1 sporulation protein YunB [Polycladospora coralii]
MRFRRSRGIISQRPHYFKVRKRKSFWVFIFVIIIAILFQVLWMIEKNLQPILIVIAKTEVKKIAQTAMTKGIQEIQKEHGEELNQAMQIEKDRNGTISSIQINNAVQAKIYSTMTNTISSEMKHLDDHPIKISIGQMLESNIFSEFGPDIPIEMWPKGAAIVNVVPKMEAQGINMVRVTLMVNVHTEMGMVVPFSKESIPVDFQYPIADALVVGDVPEYYFYNDQNGVMQRGELNSPVVPPTPEIKNP